MAQEWNIRLRGHVCQDCRRPFGEGETCVSALHAATAADGSPTTERADRCRACWDAVDAATASSVWQSPYHAPEPPPPDPAPRQTVEALLRRLMESDEAAAHQPVIYVLAVMLERKKLLIERDAKRQDDGTLTRVYEHRKTGEVLLISDPGLRLDQLAPVQEQVAALLSAPPEPSPDTVSEPASEPSPDAAPDTPPDAMPDTPQPSLEPSPETTGAATDSPAV